MKLLLIVLFIAIVSARVLHRVREYDDSACTSGPNGRFCADMISINAMGGAGNFRDVGIDCPDLMNGRDVMQDNRKCWEVRCAFKHGVCTPQSAWDEIIANGEKGNKYQIQEVYCQSGYVCIKERAPLTTPPGEPAPAKDEKKALDARCTNIGGECMVISQCSAAYRRPGLCSGDRFRQCCLPEPSNEEE